jgi:hypothetical protein
MILLASLPAFATTYVVKPDGMGDLPTIQMAIDACEEGDTVLVAPGTYTGVGNKDIELAGINIILISQAGQDETIIDCEADRFLASFSGETSATLIKGFTIRNAVGHNGAAILCQLSSPTIESCLFVDNVSIKGGAVWLAQSNTRVSDCVFEENRASEYGGGLFALLSNPEITDCVFVNNSAWEGGGLAVHAGTANLIGCVIVANEAHDGGGIGMRAATIEIRRSTISGNSATFDGGGVLADWQSEDEVIAERTILWGNCANGDGREGLFSAAHFVCGAIDSAGVAGEVYYDGAQVFEDPLFCDPHPCGTDLPTDIEEFYSLQNGSPCLPGDSPCGELIGALPVGCPVSSVPDPASHRALTWGRIKSAFRR